MKNQSTKTKTIESPTYSHIPEYTTVWQIKNKNNHEKLIFSILLAFDHKLIFPNCAGTPFRAEDSEASNLTIFTSGLLADKLPNAISYGALDISVLPSPCSTTTWSTSWWSDADVFITEFYFQFHHCYSTRMNRIGIFTARWRRSENCNWSGYHM